MRDEIFGKSTFKADSDGISHQTYTFPQGIERLVRGVAERVHRLAQGKMLWIKDPKPIGFRNRTEWAIGEIKVEGFVVRIELNDFGSECPSPIKGTWPDRLLHQLYKLLPLERWLMVACYTPEGYYIGDLNQAFVTYGAWGLRDVQPFSVAAGVECAFEAIENKYTCSIGYDPKKEAWVGWSHRAASIFEKGHLVKKGNCEASSGFCTDYLDEHPEEDLSVPIGFEVKTLEDSKRCAIAFAKSVN